MNARVDALHRTMGSGLPLRQLALDDKYTALEGEIYLSGIQALVRLPLMQRLRDQRAGLQTGGFISGYRGSPLGGLDEALWKARKHLDAHHVRFVPGVNEELAATAVWGSQQVQLLGDSDYDGVFGLWYGKGPGVDRSIDVFKHMNHAGSSRHGGVLLVAGDDHGAYSSTLPHQSDHVFAASMIPLLYPCNVQEYIELGLHGWAMSRFSGCAVGFKALADTVESSASVTADPFAVQTLLPREFEMPEGGLNCRLSTDTLGVQARRQEALMQDHKIYAAMAYARENRLNRVTIDSPQARLGIVASGKSYLDVLEALEELGIDEGLAAAIGIRVFKVSMPWPLEPEGIREFSRGLEEILVVEEKRQVVEYQLKEQLYNWREDARPRVIGKFDERGEWDVHNPRGRGDWLLPPKADFSVAQLARVIAGRIVRLGLETRTGALIEARLAFLEAKDTLLARTVATPPRPAWYCSGCPHNTSTRVPEGSFALAGIGCHVMATAIYPEFNKLTTQMGGEGAPWIGATAFSKVPHVFANLGDGTYYHSGYLSVRAAVAANRTMPVNITYKILYNDAVAMTGGQPVDGPIGVREIARQLSAEGVARIAVVTEDLSRYASRAGLPADVTLHDRAELDAVQRELRTVAGVSVIVYDQTCAAEKRRRRKKKELPEATERVFINELVCEGCGDCGQQSNCTSILPKETEFGRKRSIDQSSCNSDVSCLKGFCPSFVTVRGGKPRRGSPAVRPDASEDFARLPLPAPADLTRPCNILITGIGGTGVITIGALLGMAAHLERKGASVLDMTGMSQKNGSVTSHVRIAAEAGQLRAQRIATGEADLVLACDLLTAGSADAIARMRPERTLAVVNSHEQPAGPFARDPDWQFPAEGLRGLIGDATGGRMEFLDATQLATALTGDAIAANLFLLGYAFQKGALPVTLAALLRAIELNGVAVEANVRAFQYGRLAADDLGKLTRLAQPQQVVTLHRPQGLEHLVARRTEFLTSYQDRSYAASYAAFVDRVRAAEQAAGLGDRLARAVATNLFKLMAYKDEYEVARLYTAPEFRRALEAEFEGRLRLSFHLAPPALGGGGGGTPPKRRFGSWMRAGFALLARLKFLRGTPFDPFGYTEERRTERSLVLEYRARIESVLARMDAQGLDQALQVARVPEMIRGFGHVKAKSIAAAHSEWRRLQEPLGRA
ncbi:MAG TPA: indolepyruvate ferredoxin oxidoreductase family protein [Ramlibacter sp.]|nr:indolepyruvate ferredoxin oxidoreductase family protein [Ramlibacter sp.]